MSLCPCGSKKLYEQCCELFIEGKETPQTPEQLMRSRYSAYSLAKIDYIKNTMKGKPLLNFDEAQAKEWAQNVDWLGLKVLDTYLETPEKGFVAFTVRYKENNRLQKIEELSEFHKENNIWFYVDGTNNISVIKKNQQKTSRNTPCPCGSGKKFKNCHDQ